MNPNRLAALYSDPARERRLGVRFALGAVVLAALAALAVVGMVAGGFRLGLVPVVLVCGVGALMFALLAVNNLILARQTGEDLLTLAVEKDGIVGPGQVRADWDEITGVELRTHGRARRADAGHTPREVVVRVRDHGGLLARTDPDQHHLLDREPDGSGKMATGLGAATDPEVSALVDVLRAELARRAIPFDEGRPTPSGARA
ncbi:hypothetical protein [Luteipulveratus halotolerans]|uniref:PH domain-containing protein n=1 Tax=Luteipulveratus halotolerans TaxID=1631356 RepID=A0A0L6CMK9_9MICO|nr:hypothetical protein [Luteipulveratus halotolerans]KNX39021.1 hypothetical protein VV01_20830 [Luteipulveratus halotolerans]